MAKDYLAMAQDLTLQELKRLLAVKQQLEKLERKRDDLQKELAKVEKEIARLSGEKRGAARPARKKATRKKAAKKATKKATKKVAKKTAKKKVAKKVVRKKTVRKATGKAGKIAAGRPRLEDVIADLLGKHGGTMSVKDILAAFKEGKLFPTRSKNFENVLRRTLSTSKRIVRVGRGVYKLQ